MIRLSLIALLFTSLSSGMDAKVIEQDFPQAVELGIANNPNKLSFPESDTNEPSIIVNPTFANNIIVSANDSQNPSGVNLTGIYASFDAGHTWNRQILDFSSTGFSSQADNNVVFGPKLTSKGFSFKQGARAYVVADVFPNNFTSFAEAVALAFSDDGGITWTGFKIIGPADPTVENDKPLVAADIWPCSPFFGNVYSTWTHQQFTDPNQSTLASETIQVTTSSDAGQTFSTPIGISSSNVDNQLRWGSFPVVACDGTLYVFWWEVADIEASNGFLQVINGNKSTDGGRTWLPQPFRVATLNFPPAGNFPFAPPPGASFFRRPIPSAACDPFGNVYVVFTNYDVSLGHGWLSLAKSSDGGCTWNEKVVANVEGRSPVYPSVAASRFVPNHEVVVSFLAFDDVPVGTPVEAGSVFMDAYTVLSGDDGKTFSRPATKVSTVSTDPDVSAGSASPFGLRFEFMGDYTWVTDSPDGSFYYAWTDGRRGQTCAAVDSYRNGGPLPDINTQCTTNFGRTDIFVAHITEIDQPAQPCTPLVGELVE